MKNTTFEERSAESRIHVNSEIYSGITCEFLRSVIPFIYLTLLIFCIFSVYFLVQNYIEMLQCFVTFYDLTSAFLGAYMLFRKYMRSEDCGLEILPCI